MKSKLTLRLDDDLVRRAKAYGRRRGKSVSQVVADYFQLLGDEAEPCVKAEATTPLVASLHGILAGRDVDESDYRAWLERRYG